MNKKKQIAVIKYLVAEEAKQYLYNHRHKHIEELSKKKFYDPIKKNYLTFGKSTIYRYVNILEAYLEEKSKENLAIINTNKDKVESEEEKQEIYSCFERKPRKVKSKAIPTYILEFAIDLRKDVPSRTTAKLIEIIKEEYNFEVKRSTLNYHLSKRGYSRLIMKVVDSKIYIRFESSHINALWIGDYHDASGLLQDGQEVHLSAFIDCNSRFIVHAQYYLKEDLLTLEDSFKKATLKCGCPKVVFVDNAKIYHASRFIYCCLKLGIRAPLYSKPYVKESRGNV